MPFVFRLLKTVGIEVQMFGNHEDILFFVRHVEHIIKLREENKEINVSKNKNLLIEKCYARESPFLFGTVNTRLKDPPCV